MSTTIAKLNNGHFALHTSKIGNLLPVCLRNNRHLANYLAVQQELLSVLDKYPECFSDKPGLCTLVTHKINVTNEFKHQRLRAYRVPEPPPQEVEKQMVFC